MFKFFFSASPIAPAQDGPPLPIVTMEEVELLLSMKTPSPIKLAPRPQKRQRLQKAAMMKTGGKRPAKRMRVSSSPPLPDVFLVASPASSGDCLYVLKSPPQPRKVVPKVESPSPPPCSQAPPLWSPQPSESSTAIARLEEANMRLGEYPHVMFTDLTEHVTQ
jgi:hypothetical protein